MDGFQGQERPIIIFSAVRSNQEGHIGFLKDIRRLNVSITRAQLCMWIVGDATTLLQSRSPAWRALIDNARARNAYVDAQPSPGGD